ncbi:MAG: ATP-binding protein [Gemmataceae bacterium]
MRLPADPVQLGQLIGSLLGNAIDAAGPGGTVEVRWRSPPTG